MKKQLITFLFLLFASSQVMSQIEYITPSERLRKGIEYFEEGNYAKAQNQFRDFSVNDSFYSRSGYLLYLSHRALQEWEKATDATYKFAHDLTIENRDLYYELAGKSAFHGSLYKRGVEILKEGLSVFDKDPDLYNYLAKNYIMLGEDSLAYEATLKGLKVSPFHRGLLENLGELNANQKNYTQASMAYYVALFVTFHERKNDRNFDRLGKTSELLEKLQSTLGGDFDASLFHFNWDGDEDSKEKYEDIKLAKPVSNTFTITNYYKEVDELLDADLALNSRYKSRSKINYNFAKQSQLMGDKLNELSTPRDVEADYFIYGNILQEVIGQVTANKKLLTHFHTSIMAMFSLKYLNKALKKYDKKSVPLNREITKIASQAMYDIPILYEGKMQKANRRFSAYDFAFFAIGDLIDANGTDEISNRKGHWEYFYRNGELETSGEYVEGEKDGVWDEFNKQGVLTNTYTYDKGKFVQMKDFEVNGKLQMVRNIKNFELTDSFNTYYPDGGTKRLIYMPKGIKSNGTIASYYSNGQLMFETDLKDFELNSYLKQYNKRGGLDYEVDYKDGKQEGVVKSYYENEKLFMEGNYSNGERDGTFTYYDKDGNKTTVLNYSKGEKDGKQTYYFRNGKISSETNYKNGEKDGDDITYQKNGKIETREKYDEGELVSIECFDVNGNSIYKKKLGSSTKLEIPHTNGEISAKGRMKDGKKTGEWKYYNEYGQLIEESEYSDGKADGKVTTYYSSGLKYSEYFMKEGDYHGKYISYWPNGKKRTEGFYVNDERQGEWLYFYQNGNLSSKTYYVEDEVHGYQYDYDVKGKLNSNIYYKNEWSYYRVSFDSTENPIDTLHYVDPISSQYYTLNVLGDTTFICPLKNNELHGKAIYHPNTDAEQYAQYDNGDIDKEFVIKDDLGNKTAVKVFDLDDRVSFIAYNGHPGKITYNAKYKHNKLSGLVSSYYPNGKIRIETNYVDGDRQGIQKRYAPDGSLCLVIQWEDDEMIAYGESEDKLKDIEATTKIEFKHSNGKPKAQLTIKHGSFDGDFKLFNKNGSIGVHIPYTNGYINGIYRLYNQNGVIQKQVDYIYGDFNGKYIIYDSRGNKILETNYVNDEMHGWNHYYKNGKILKSVYYYNDEPLYEK